MILRVVKRQLRLSRLLIMWSQRFRVLPFEKFPQADSRLTTQMKSVGEVMAIGGSFQESFQKALRGLEVGVDGLDSLTTDIDVIAKELGEPRSERIWYLGDAFRMGMSAKRRGLQHL